MLTENNEKLVDVPKKLYQLSETTTKFKVQLKFSIFLRKESLKPLHSLNLNNSWNLFKNFRKINDQN